MASDTYILRKGQDIEVNSITIAGTAVTATATELNIMDGVTATTAELNLNDNQWATVVMTVGAEAANVITVGCQFNDAAGTAMATRCWASFFLSDDANGDSIAATAPDGGIAAGTDGWIEAITANKSFFGHSEADGDLDVAITETGVDTWYLGVRLLNGGVVMSAAITFA